MEEEIMTPVEYAKKYKELYSKAQILFQEYNPCESHSDGSCLRTRKDKDYAEIPADRCCGGCKFHSRTEGCKTVSLSCKVWVCGMLESYAFGGHYPKIREFMNKLRPIRSEMSQLPVYPTARESFQDTMRSLRDRIIRLTMEETPTYRGR